MAKTDKIITSAQTLTETFVDLGGEIVTNNLATNSLQGVGYIDFVVWLNITPNDSENITIRALAKQGEGFTNEYNFPLKVVKNTETQVKKNTFRFRATDLDEPIILSLKLKECIPVIQLQVKAGVMGLSAGEVTTAEYSVCSGFAESERILDLINRR